MAATAIFSLLHCGDDLESIALHPWHSSDLSLSLYIFSLFLQRYQHVYLTYWLLTSLSATSPFSEQRTLCGRWRLSEMGGNNGRWGLKKG